MPSDLVISASICEWYKETGSQLLLAPCVAGLVLRCYLLFELGNFVTRDLELENSLVMLIRLCLCRRGFAILWLCTFVH